MKYDKPEIVVTSDAVTLIQSMGKVGVLENVLHDRTTPAYEADE
jgi:hypothetical protein